MVLKFTGINGSMGLCKGKYYDVGISTCGIDSLTGRTQTHIACYVNTGFMSEVFVPYASPQAFAKNWSL